jgi:segregation and condensation protein A
LTVSQYADSSLFPESDHTAYTIRTESFEGPFDLLLHLIKKSEIDIYNIPIAAITRQYLDYLDVMQELNLEIAGDFLVMASTLIHIKSRMLLPPAPDEEAGEEEVEDPRAELVARLLEYQKYKEASITLWQRELLGRDVFARDFAAQELAETVPGEAPLEVELFDLIEAFRKLLAAVPGESFHEVGAEGLSIADRINDLLLLLQGTEAAGFDEMFIGSATRDDIIITFLAILELCKLKMVRVAQAQNFGKILIIPALLNDTVDAVTEADLDRDFA